MLRRIVPFLVLFMSALSPRLEATAQTLDIETSIDHHFGDSILFQADIVSDIPVEVAVVYYQVEGDAWMNIGLAEVEELPKAHYNAIYTHKIYEYALPPFSKLSTHWEIILANGEVITSSPTEYAYIDNRIDWNTVEHNGIRIHWEQDDQTLGDEIIDLVGKGIVEIQRYLPLIPIENLDIYIYSTDQLLSTALPNGSTDWVAGHTDPKLGVILMVLPEVPEQRLLAKQRIPHELMHMYLYNYTQSGYDKLPEWLNEGLASSVELYSNPEYQIVLGDPINPPQFFPLSSLCESMPRGSSAALLGYAQVQSFVMFLQRTFGASGIQALIQAYVKGYDCEVGFEYALGRSISQVESDWKQFALYPDSMSSRLHHLLPWLVILLVVITAPFLMAFWNIYNRRTETYQNNPKAGHYYDDK